MPAVIYYDLGHGKRLHEVVFAGTHDAGITSGAANAQTQDLDIYDQANAGARIFDLRVAACGLGPTSGTKVVQLKTFHADPKLMKTENKTRMLLGTNQRVNIERTKLKSGEWGMSLSKVLTDAKKFVLRNTNEFLLLKFDKCKAWHHIAAACIDILTDQSETGGADNVLYTDGGNLNMKTLHDLRGKVVVLFSVSGAQASGFSYQQGINVWKNLKSEDDPGAAYDPNFNGLQYFGGGGTNPFKVYGTSKKINENEKTQGKRMHKMATNTAAHAPEVLGMMYWTTTGLKASIRDRDTQQWSAVNRPRLAALWQQGLGEAIETRLPGALMPTSYSASGMLKVFMPNFVMVDFIAEEKGNYIKSLNNLAANELTQEAIRQQAWDFALGR